MSMLTVFRLNIILTIPFSEFLVFFGIRATGFFSLASSSSASTSDSDPLPTLSSSMTQPITTPMNSSHQLNLNSQTLPYPIPRPDPLILMFSRFLPVSILVFFLTQTLAINLVVLPHVLVSLIPNSIAYAIIFSGV